MVANQRIRTPLAGGGEVAVFQVVSGVMSKMVRRRGRRFIRTSFGANPEAALTELLKANSTCGKWTSQLSHRSLTTIVSI